MKQPNPVASIHITSTIPTSTTPSIRKSQSPFQQLITSSINKIRQCYQAQELHEFNELLSTYIINKQDQQQPKKIKQLNIDPYIFILQYLFNKDELTLFGLKQLNVIIDENYYSKTSLASIIMFLNKSVQKHSTECVTIVLKIKQPTVELFELFFEIYSTILLPEQIALNFRLLGYQWLIRIFQMKQTTIPLYFKYIIDKIGVFQLPQLISNVQEEKQLHTYIHKILNNLINKVQDKIQLEMGTQTVVYKKQKKGKYLYCFMCQKPADYYCKDTKVPVCSSQCKKDHLLYISSVNIVNEQFSHQFRMLIQQLLLKNWYCARSPSLSVDYLIAIYTFSQYQPQFEIQHSKIVKSPIMVQKVWLLYSSYYQKKGQMFEHIFISFLFSQNQYLQQLGKYYFLEISQTHRILEIYYNYDLKGNMRLFPIIFNVMLADRDYCSIFITNFVEMIFQNINSQHFRVTPNFVTLSSTLIELFNESQSPIQALEKYFPQVPNFSTDEQIALFLMKNETLIKKQRLTKLLDKDEEFIKAFLKQITIKREFSPIDQLLREIFYFINVNVSQKIYRLLELLYDVYEFDQLGNEDEKKVIKKDDALFQYMYLVIMLNTQLHNPNLQKKPTISQVTERIAIINKPLATEQGNKSILESMFERLKSLPFSQQTRGILQHYEPYTFKMFKLQDFYLPLMILENHEPILQTFTAISMSNPILYRVCNILTAFPQIQGTFLRFLLQRLEKQQVEDQYLLQAIRNILQQQPNAVNIQGGWKIIFNYIKEADLKRKKLQRLASSQGENLRRMDDTVTSPTSVLSASSNDGEKRRRRIFEPFNSISKSSLGQIPGHTMIWLDLQSVIVASPSLTHDNFICFFKDFASTFPMQSYFRQYEKAIHLNRKRLNSMANGLMLGFRKIENQWIGMKMVEFISSLEEVEMEVESKDIMELGESKITVSKISSMSKIKSQLILLMLKEISISEVTEPLLLSTIISLSNTPNFTLTSELWQCITHLALKFKSEENQSIVEELMKRYESCEEFYESLMIQKTLNSTQPEMINKDVLTKLDKLEPYLSDLQEKVLKMFILKDNLSVIEKNLNRFFSFVQIFVLLKQNIGTINNIEQIELFLVERIQQAIQHQVHLQSLLSQQFLDFLIEIFQKRFSNNSLVNLVVWYCNYLSLCISATSFDQKTTLDKSVIFYQTSKQLYLLAVKLKDKIKEQQIKQIQWLIEPMHMLTQFCEKLNLNIDYRKTLSQTYTFKHIVQFHQSENHAPYLIGLTKQLIECKKLIWTIKFNHNLPQAIDFLSTQITKLSLLYQTIKSQVEDFNKSLSQILDQKTIDEIFIKLRENVTVFRAYLKFALNALLKFSKISLSSETSIIQKAQKMQELSRIFFINLLFNGVFVIEIRHLTSKSTDKKTYLPRQTINSQPFSIYVQTLTQSSQPLKELTQKIIKSSVLSK